MNFLPQPVFGLIFLFHYAPQLVDEEEEDGEEAPVWFANQTTNNSCASVALVNIVMNAEDVELGDELQNFKDLTKDLNSALRGYQIGANDFIRAAHNSFARRIDLLNADLCLANEVEAAQIEPPQKRLIKRRGATSRSGDKQKTAGPRTAAARAKKKQPHVEYGFHFIAYVPAGGFVWELDGMRTKPRNIGGELTEKSWTDIVLPRIQHRIKEYGDSENGFSLLALCRSPLDTHRSLIASRLSGLRSLNTKMMGDSSFTDLVAASPDACASVVEGLDEFGLSPPIVYATGIPPFVTEHMARADFDHHEAYSLRQQLATDVATSMTKYREEVLAVAEEERRVQERRKDYMPALHCWMSKLASKGVLEEVMDTLRSGPADSP
ncbi:hypothetical protein CDD83_9070 [Cordyceps sp. RAO-2017]|nr:hypothetical protein CDD83_9070 [Cordyceps sp. RAO-2017]